MFSFEELQDFYRKFLERLCTSDALARFFETGEEGDFSNWARSIPRSRKSIGAAYGCTKAVIWDSSLPYVLKIPFGYSNNELKDYCEIERENYFLAQKIPEISGFFAKSQFLFEFRGVPIYLMDRAECNEAEIEDRAFTSALNRSKELQEFSEDVDSEDFFQEFSHSFDYAGDERKIDALLVEQWGEVAVDIFWDFCRENNINDLHFGNWGVLNDKIVLVDYSGYHGDFDSSY